MPDLYRVLGVDRKADQAEIRKSYKKMAREFHPDLNKEPHAADRFKEINAAYEVLGDEEKRALYDEFGDLALKPGFSAAQARAWKRGGGMGGGFPGGFPGGGGVDFGELFGSLFSGGMGGMGGGPRGRRGPVKGADLEGSVSVELLEALRGGSASVVLRQPVSCERCQGEGGTGRSPCGVCRGSGRVQMAQMGGVSLPCNACGGGGSTFEAECEGCGGTGRTTREQSLKIKLPIGVEDGKVIRLRGKGGEGQRGGPPGDLLLVVEVRPHSHLRREGPDLYMDLPITMLEAVVGGKVPVPLLDGEVRLHIPPGAQNGQKLRLRGKGVEIEGQRGDLYVVLRPTPPPAGAEVERLARELEAHYTTDLRAPLREQLQRPVTTGG